MPESPHCSGIFKDKEHVFSLQWPYFAVFCFVCEWCDDQIFRLWVMWLKKQVVNASIPFLYHYMQSLTWCSVRLFCLYDHMECVLSTPEGREHWCQMSIGPTDQYISSPIAPKISWIWLWMCRGHREAWQNVSTLLRYSPMEIYSPIVYPIRFLRSTLPFIFETICKICMVISAAIDLVDGPPYTLKRSVLYALLIDDVGASQLWVCGKLYLCKVNTSYFWTFIPPYCQVICQCQSLFD